MTRSAMTLKAILICSLSMGGIIGCGDAGSRVTPLDHEPPYSIIPPVNPPGGGGTDGQCRYNGTLYQTGDIFCAEDGCNTCQCNPEGSTGVGCTQRSCGTSGVSVDGVCANINIKPPELCPHDEEMNITYQNGESCAASFRSCTLPSHSCSEVITCNCREGQIICDSSFPREGVLCGEELQGETCSSYPLNPDEPSSFCTCDGVQWSCVAETCPPEMPEPYTSCSFHELLMCDYFHQETQCDYLDLYRHCSCEDGSWSCWVDTENCPRG